MSNNVLEQTFAKLESLSKESVGFTFGGLPARKRCTNCMQTNRTRSQTACTPREEKNHETDQQRTGKHLTQANADSNLATSRSFYCGRKRTGKEAVGSCSANDMRLESRSLIGSLEKFAEQASAEAHNL